MNKFSRGVGLKDRKLVFLPNTPITCPATNPVRTKTDPAGPECPHFTPSRQPREAKLSHRNKLGLNFVQNSKDKSGGQHRKVTQVSPVLHGSIGEGRIRGNIKRPLKAFKGAPATPHG